MEDNCLRFESCGDIKHVIESLERSFPDERIHCSGRKIHEWRMEGEGRLVVELLLHLFQVGRRNHIEGIAGKIYLKVKASFPDEVKIFEKPAEGYMDVRSDHFSVSEAAFFSDFGSFLDSFLADDSGFSFLSALSFASFLSFPA